MVRKSDLLSLRFSNGGLFSTKKPYRHSTRVIDSYELIVVTKGTLYMQQDGKDYTLDAGSYLLLAPGVVHGGTNISDKGIEYYWLHFYVDDQRGIQVPEGFGSLPWSARLTSPGVIIQAARQLLHCVESPSYPQGVCEHIMFVLFSEIISQSVNTLPQNSLALRTHEYIRSHANTMVTASSVAESLGYNSDYLSRILKDHYGRTLQQDIVHERLERAKLLLQTSDFTVERIALELGYESANLFVKFFRYHLKTTPTAYRNSYTKLHTNHI